MPGSPRVLVVDDDPAVHELLRLALRGTVLELGSAFDGNAGLALVSSGHWDLIITDVEMPGLTGMALLEKIRALKPALPVIVMTAANTAENIVAAIRDKASGWLTKPFTSETVLETLETALASPPDDDIEVLSASPVWLEVRMRCRLETAGRILHFVRQMETGLDPSDRERVGAAFREILTNAIEHGGRNDPDASVTVTYIRAEHALLYRVRDPGPGFSLEGLQHAAISNTPDDPLAHAAHRQNMGLRPGGFGIMMTRALVDELIYNEKGNEVLLIKYLR